ncbi:hypothetical protein [Mycolicibacterium llatzerense]|uniref:hypothetical protein n=2 Tax=Mycolicibacterium llatzerense TaxID=280871 RepID=UPI0021B63141|nr:hypothetical protein [Mycolicibacterium llatzerense]
MDQWTRHARWAHRDMYPQLVAELFDTSTECLLQDIAAGSPVYPRPREVGLGNPTWSELAVFSAIWERFPALGPRIPRLFPDPGSSRAAEFVGTQVLALGSRLNVHRYGVHLWLPGDSRGVVALAYRAGADDVCAPAAARLLRELPTVSAVIVPEVRARTVPGGQFGDHQPSVHVAERGSSPLSAWAWFDVVALLRTDIPWFSDGADLDTIVSWHPGVPARPSAVDRAGCSALITTVNHLRKGA